MSVSTFIPRRLARGIATISINATLALATAGGLVAIRDEQQLVEPERVSGLMVPAPKQTHEGANRVVPTYTPTPSPRPERPTLPEYFIGDPDAIDGWPARWFTAREFASKGDGSVCIRSNLVVALDRVRQAFGRPIVITSGYRDLMHNRRVGGARRSQHVLCAAVDLSLKGLSTEERTQLMMMLFEQGFSSFGSYDGSPDMLHADMREKPAKWDHHDGQHPGWFSEALVKTGWPGRR